MDDSNFTDSVKAVKVLLTRYILLKQNRNGKLYIPQGFYIALHDFYDAERYIFRSGLPYVIVKDDYLEAFAGLFNPQPLFYTIKRNGTFLLSDDIYVLVYDDDIEGSPNSFLEFRELKNVLGRNTLVNGIYLLEAGKKLICQDNRCEVQTTFVYMPLGDVLDDQELAEELFWHIIKEVFRECAEILRNKIVIVPLSAGYDSRFILSMLFLMKNRPIALTYGAKYSYEFPIAKAIAKKLGLHHMLIEYTDEDWNYVCNILPEYLFKNSQLFRTPNIQELISTIKFDKIFQKEFALHKDVVFVPGDTGDFLSGKQLLPKSVVASNLAEAAQAILESHHTCFSLYPIELRETLTRYLSKLYAEVKHYNPDHKPKIYELVEMFNWRERQYKFIASARLPYTLLGYGHLFPLWDKRIVSFFASLSLKFKKYQKFYLDFLEKNVFSQLDISSDITRIMKSKIIPLLTSRYINIHNLLKKALLVVAKRNSFVKNPCGFDVYFPKLYYKLSCSRGENTLLVESKIKDPTAYITLLTLEILKRKLFSRSLSSLYE
ncbi:MAG: hypothetical protein QXK88_07785 [Desulfurococcaceae archaeon]